VHQISISSKFQWVPEASVLMLCGFMLILFFAWYSEYRIYEFDANLFYYALLPPVIFNSGLDIDYKCFHQNFLTIMVYANLGTIINAVIVCFFLYAVGLTGYSTSISVPEGITFGALISATDPVTTLAVFDRLQVEQNLFGIIVGVSILDDAVSVIIFNLFNSLISDSTSLSVGQCTILFGEFLVKFVASILLGMFFGILFSRILKLYKSLNDRIPQLTAIIFLFMYLTYFFGDGYWFSGIITNLFAAIYFRKFYEKNFPMAYEKIKIAVSSFAYLLETLVFVLIGLSLTSHTLNDWRFFGWSLVACLLGRAGQVYPLAAILNCYNVFDVNTSSLSSSSQTNHSIQVVSELEPNDRNHSPRAQNMSTSSASLIPRGVKLSRGYQHMIFLAGLRGPIAYATAQLFNNAAGNNNLVASTTALTVVFTTFVFGILTWPALKWFHIPHSEHHNVVNNINSSSYTSCNWSDFLSFFRTLFTFREDDAEAIPEDSLHNLASSGTGIQLQNIRSNRSLLGRSSKPKWQLLKSEDTEEEMKLENGGNNITSSVLHQVENV
jgi:NhaP-type Na+/H+ or K+/H+ antiporter